MEPAWPDRRLGRQGDPDLRLRRAGLCDELRAPGNALVGEVESQLQGVRRGEGGHGRSRRQRCRQPTHVRSAREGQVWHRLGRADARQWHVRESGRLEVSRVSRLESDRLVEDCRRPGHRAHGRQRQEPKLSADSRRLHLRQQGAGPPDGPESARIHPLRAEPRGPGNHPEGGRLLCAPRFVHSRPAEEARLIAMKTIRYILGAVSLTSFFTLATGHAIAQQSQPTEESKKLPAGSAAERKARMAARANQPAYTKKFDLAGFRTTFRKTSPAERCGSPATTMSATRPLAAGGRKPSRNSSRASGSSTTCRRRPSPSLACISTWRTSASITSPASTTAWGICA